jgi:hypothetical protein
MEGSLVAYKVFTNGSVLNASEINDNLMNQAVMVFSNSAARTAAIPSPVEGMLSWLQDVDRFENYNGSAWVNTVTTPAYELIGSTTVGAASSVNIDNIFTSAYRVYKIIGTTISTANVERFSTRYIKASDGLASSQSATDGFGAQPLGGSGLISQGTTSTTTHTVGIAGVGKNSIELTCFEPFLNTQTVTTCLSNGSAYYSFGASHQASESERGITIAHTVSSWTSAEFRVYGLRDS